MGAIWVRCRFLVISSGMFSRIMSSGSQFVMEGVKNLVVGNKVKSWKIVPVHIYFKFVSLFFSNLFLMQQGALQDVHPCKIPNQRGSDKFPTPPKKQTDRNKPTNKKYQTWFQSPKNYKLPHVLLAEPLPPSLSRFALLPPLSLSVLFLLKMPLSVPV